MLDSRRVGFDGRVTAHAFVGRHDGHGLAWVGIRVTHSACQLHSAGVHFVVAERDGLNRRVGRRQDRTQAEYCQQYPEKRHMLRWRICSARYSDARTARDRMVIEVLPSAGDESRAVHHEEVLHVVTLVEFVQHTGLGIVTHAAGSQLMNAVAGQDESLGPRDGVPSRVVEQLLDGIRSVLREVELVLAIAPQCGAPEFPRRPSPPY